MSEVRQEPICEHCGSKRWVHDYESGEAICSNGHVRKENTYSGPVRAEDPATGEKGMQFGTPESITTHDMGLATKIGWNNVDAQGVHITGEMRSTLERMRKWDARSQVNEPQDKNLRQAMVELDRYADKLHVPQAAKEKAAYLYRKALERGVIRGRSITGMMAASLYASSKDMGRTLKDVSEVTGVKKKDIARDYRTLFWETDMKAQVDDVTRAISKVGSLAGVKESTKRIAIERYREAKEKEKQGVIAGKNSMGLAASLLYIACNQNGDLKTQKELAEAAGVTEVTVRNRYKGLRADMGWKDVKIESSLNGDYEKPAETRSNDLAALRRDKDTGEYAGTDRAGRIEKDIKKLVYAIDDLERGETDKMIGRAVKELRGTDLGKLPDGIDDDVVASAFVFGAGRGRTSAGERLAGDLAELVSMGKMKGVDGDQIRSLWEDIKRSTYLETATASVLRQRSQAKKRLRN
ncbi:MAG: hypothetical protein KGH57_01235 [Candidatus Micrarchaeota archaeon]|nr:hypothetical protein [Candidatus Micrarchaeota archaeon]